MRALCVTMRVCVCVCVSVSAFCWLLYGITKAYRQHNRDTRLCNKVASRQASRQSSSRAGSQSVSRGIIINVIIIIIIIITKTALCSYIHICMCVCMFSGNLSDFLFCFCASPLLLFTLFGIVKQSSKRKSTDPAI